MNNADKTHCPAGHEYTPENTKIYKDGARRCRICIQNSEQAFKAKWATEDAQQVITPSMEKRFWAKVIRQDGCWDWNGRVGGNNYGLLRLNSKSIIASRFSYLLHKGPIPAGYFVCHTCDNPPCTNPEHLFLGSPKENVRDMLDKGRQTWQMKTHCPYGHEYSPENTFFVKATNGRQCRECKRRRDRTRRESQKAKA